jgi:acid phosphatase family membrane protein YuiD
MPSAHSATVCSLATVIGMVEGFQSAIFASSVFFAFIVIYDAAGVRKTVSVHSGVINDILDELFKDNPEFQQRFREFIGHTRLEIITGAIMGILLAWWWA